jgi:hypothetical protein
MPEVLAVSLVLLALVLIAGLALRAAYALLTSGS